MSDDAEPYPTTLIGRMVKAGLDGSKARGHIEGGAVRVDGEQVTDPQASAPWPARWVITAT